MSRRALITGAAGGLGAALTRSLRSRGDRVLVTDLPGALEAAGIDGLPLDVTSDDDWARIRAHVESDGGLDLLINNAGIAGGGRLDVAGIDEWQRLTEINLLGTVRGLAAFVPLLKRQRSGRILNIASLAGLVHPAGMGAYNATKAAVVALSETAAHELAGFGIGVSVACPSYFRTGLLESMSGADERVAAVIAGLVANAPLGPDEMAERILTGLDRGEQVILPDDAARDAVALKRSDPAAYAAQLRRQAARLQGE